MIYLTSFCSVVFFAELKDFRRIVSIVDDEGRSVGSSSTSCVRLRLKARS
jgi:hypothetical protein